MTDEAVIPIGEFQPTCPHCGANILIEHDGVEPKPDDRVFCAEHGTIGTREAIRAQILDENRDKIKKAATDHASNMIRDMFKRAGLDPD